MEQGFLAHKLGVTPRVTLSAYEGKHRTPEIPKGVYGVSLGSHKRGIWLNTVEDRSTDPNVR